MKKRDKKMKKRDKNKYWDKKRFGRMSTGGFREGRGSESVEKRPTPISRPLWSGSENGSSFSLSYFSLFYL